jgi:hypothetical protein
LLAASSTWGSDDSKVYALNAATGTLVWNYATGGAVWSSPAVIDGVVYVGSDDNKTYCLNASTGAHIWDYTTGGAVESSPAVAGGMVFVGSWDNYVYALSAATGTLVWNYMTYGAVFSSPAVAGGVVYVSSLNGNIYAIGARWQVDVYWSYRTEPAPMGIADYGIGPSGPYEYATKSFVGIVTVASLLTNRSSNYLVSFQLNVEFEFNTTCGLRVFWMQNVAVVTTFGSALCLENFVVNVWNWSEPSAIIDASGISGKGQFGTPQDPYGYVCTRDGNFTPFNRTTPITITLNVTSGVSSSGEPTVSFAYDVGNGSVTYDTVTFTNVTVTSTPGFEVNGFKYAPNDAFYESALILGGLPVVTTDVLSDVQLQLEYWNGHNYQIVPNAYNFGSNTAERIDNVLSGFSHHPGNGEIFAEILPGAGQLGELYNQFQTGVINITSPLTLGTLYVTNASDPDATAWQIPFVSGEVTVTLYPGCYDLQLYNQYGELFDQGNFTVNAGQTLSLQTPFNSLRQHDVAVTNVTTCKEGCTPFPTVGQNWTMHINVTVENQGDYPEVFNVIVYANTTVINQTQLTLPDATPTVLTIKWNATLPYGNYTLSAVADAVENETDTGDNTYVGGTILVTIPGDVTTPGLYVQYLDLGRVIGTAYGKKTGSPLYDLNTDFNDDHYTQYLDLGILLAHYGQHNP